MYYLIIIRDSKLNPESSYLLYYLRWSLLGRLKRRLIYEEKFNWRDGQNLLNNFNRYWKEVRLTDSLVLDWDRFMMRQLSFKSGVVMFLWLIFEIDLANQPMHFCYSSFNGRLSAQKWAEQNESAILIHKILLTY